MTLDLSNLIGKPIESTGIFTGKGFKFKSSENIEIVDIVWYHNKTFKEVVINIVPSYIDVYTHTQWYSRDRFETSIEMKIYTDKRIYIGTMTLERNVSHIQIGHLTYIKNGNKWVKEF